MGGRKAQKRRSTGEDPPAKVIRVDPQLLGQMLDERICIRIDKVPHVMQEFPNTGYHGLRRALRNQSWDLQQVFLLDPEDVQDGWPAHGLLATHVDASNWPDVVRGELTFLHAVCTRQEPRVMDVHELVAHTWREMSSCTALRNMPQVLGNIHLRDAHARMKFGIEKVRRYWHLGQRLLDAHVLSQWDGLPVKLYLDGTTVRRPFELTHVSIHLTLRDGSSIMYTIGVICQVVTTVQSLFRLLDELME